MHSIKIRVLISIRNGEIGEAISMLTSFFESNDEKLYYEVVLIQAQFSKFENERRKGLLTSEDYRVYFVKITYAVLYLLKYLP